jgi:hypothetical protein
MLWLVVWRSAKRHVSCLMEKQLVFVFGSLGDWIGLAWIG